MALKNSKKLLFKFLLFNIILLENSVMTQNTNSMAKLRVNASYMKAMTELQKLSAYKTKDELRMIATLGLVSGALEVVKSMENNLTNMVTDIILNSDMNNKMKIMQKFDKLENMMERDKNAIEILGSALDLARGDITRSEYRRKMKTMLRDYQRKQRDIKHKQTNISAREKFDELKPKILEHIDMMHKTIDDRAKKTIKFLKKKQALSSKNKRSNQAISKEVDKNITMITLLMAMPIIETNQTKKQENSSKLESTNVLEDILTNSSDENLIDRNRRQDMDLLSINTTMNNEDSKSAAQYVDSSDEDTKESAEDTTGEGGGGAGGGLVGLIGSLSGGEGSDFGALFGALTGVVMRLFGPGGLDIPSLLSTGTALLAGLLAGEKNFGTVLGEYVGLAVDGFSGGGGAINNGQFFGNFLGTVLAQLSADPEDEDQPPKPLIFLQNFITSFTQAKNRNSPDGVEGDDNRDQNTGSDSFGFITHIVRTIVGGITSVLLNASLGSSGGSSQGSAAAFTGSSHPKGHPQPNGNSVE